MAGPSVMVRILGDASNLAKSATDVGSKFSKAASSAHAAFSSMLGTLNQTGVLGPFGDALSTADQALSNLTEHGKNISSVMLGAGGALVAVGGIFSSLGSKEKAAHQQLSQAITNTGQAYGTYADQIDKAVKHNEKFGDSSVETQGALQTLTQATGSPAAALKLLGTATDLAAAKHEDLNTAATQLGRTYNGNAKLLKEYGIVVDKHTHLTKDGQTATQALAGVLKGQAAASADTFNGKIKGMSTAIEDHVSLLGEKYGPALQKTGAVIAGLGGIMKVGKATMDLFSSGQKAAAAATDVMSASEDTAAVSEGLALWPILLIIAAIGLLVLAAYEIYKHWKQIWGDIKTIINDVWDWIKKNWPLLVDIILGPIGIVATELYKHWKTIKDDAKDVIDFITKIWNGMVSFFTGIPARLQAVAGHLFQFIIDAAQTAAGIAEGVWNSVVGWMAGLPARIGGVVAGLWNGIYNEANRIWGLVAGIWNGMVSWVAGLGGRITGVASGMWNGITQAFRGALDALIDLWNQLHFKLPAINFGPIHLGGETIGVPTIPHLAQGGLMTASGLVFAHAGEVITPAPAAAARGPVVHIDHAHFAQRLDVDAFMDRVAWAARKKAV